MNWYKTETGLKSHVKLTRLAKLLKVEEVTALGYIHYFLSFVAEYAETGHLHKHSGDEIEMFCHWRGKKGSLLAAFQAAHIIDKNKRGFTAHGFFERNTRHYKDIMRKRAVRNGVTAVSPRRQPGVPAVPLRTNERTNEGNEHPAFPQFWDVYPARQGRKEGKSEASAEFTKLNPDEALVAKIMEAVKSIENEPYPLNAAKWLQAKRWLDEKVVHDDKHLPPHLRARAI